jgi:hypothetical protein
MCAAVATMREIVYKRIVVEESRRNGDQILATVKAPTEIFCSRSKIWEWSKNSREPIIAVEC